MNYSRPFLSRELDQWLPLAKQAIATLCPDDSLLQFNREDQKWHPVTPASIVGSPYDFIAPLEVVNGNDVQITPSTNPAGFYAWNGSDWLDVFVDGTPNGLPWPASIGTNLSTLLEPVPYIGLYVTPHAAPGQIMTSVVHTDTSQSAAVWLDPSLLTVGEGVITVTPMLQTNYVTPPTTDEFSYYETHIAIAPGVDGEILTTFSGQAQWLPPVVPTIETFELLIAQTSTLRMTAEMNTSTGTPGDLIDFTSSVTGSTTDSISNAVGFGALIPGLTVGINVLVPSGGSPTGPILSVVDDLGNVFTTIDLSVLVVAEKDAVPGTTFKMLGLGRKLSLRLDTLAVDYSTYTIVVNALATFTPT